jgi:hypothetical protein
MDFSEALKEVRASEGTGTPMPAYRSHKTVWALKINDVLPAPLPTIDELDRILNGDEGRSDIGAILVVEGHFAPIAVSRDWVAKHVPTKGGYYVAYRDGYTSFSPCAAFEEGYTKIA